MLRAPSARRSQLFGGEARPRSIRPVKRFALVGSLVLLAAGCGHRGPLIAPLPPVPQAPREASWRQRGGILGHPRSIPAHRLGRAQTASPFAFPVVLAVPASNPGGAASWNTVARDQNSGVLPGRFCCLPSAADQLGKTVNREDRVQVESLGGKSYAVLSVALTDKRSRSSGTPRLVLPLAWFPASGFDPVGSCGRGKGCAIELGDSCGRPDHRPSPLSLGAGVPFLPGKPGRSSPPNSVCFWTTPPAMDRSFIMGRLRRWGREMIRSRVPFKAGPLDYRDIFPPVSAQGSRPRCRNFAVGGLVESGKFSRRSADHRGARGRRDGSFPGGGGRWPLRTVSFRMKQSKPVNSIAIG